MPTGLSLAGFAYPISNVIVPQGGPKTVGAVLDFSNVAEIDIDGQQIIDAHAMEFIQGVYVDNADNAAPITFVCGGTGHRIVVPANSQGFFPLLVQNPPKIVATMQQVNGRKVNCQFYNVPIMSCFWKTV